MKFQIIFALLFLSCASSPKNDEIDKKLSDSFKKATTANKTTVFKYSDLSLCGYNVKGFFKNDSLLFLESITYPESGFTSRKIYLKNNNVEK